MAVQPRPTLLASPVFALSIVLLIVNDHVLKGAWPGLVTGKLSDFAGVAMIAILLTAVLGQASVAVPITAVSFALLKTEPRVAEWAAPVLGGVTRTDPHDLLALLVLAPLWRWLVAHITVGVGDRRRHPTALRIALVGAAVFATTATSCETEGVSAVYAYDGVLLAAASDHEYMSLDGGITWHDWPEDREIDWERLARQTQVCADSICWAVDERSARLTQTTGTSDIEVLELDESQQDALRDLGNPECVSQAFATIAFVDLPDGQHVVVSMGPAGALHRGHRGAWQWVRVGRWGVPDDVTETYLDLPVAMAD